MESIYKLGILLSVVDRITGPSTKIGKNLDGLKGRAAALGPVFDKFKSYGLVVATAGAFMLHALTGTAMATVDTQAALGELASVGVADMAALEAAGQQFSNQWSGTGKADFIGAAYDIKSGISSLTDTGVAEFTKLAALTGKATKSTTAEMTSLFATGYGIYKGAYDQLTDLQFGELFSAGIAASVQSFKTTGSGMAQAISSLGATATTAKIPMEEQLSILGMLQATMTGSEAGTKYKAMMQAAAGAGQKLNLQFMDANNQLLSMPDILTELQGKYGSTLDAVEKMEIQKAFGTQEAVAVIDLFYGQVDQLTDNIDGLGKSMQQGTGFTEQMAAAMNQDIGAGVGLLGQQWHNLVEIIGKQLIPVLVPLFSWIGGLIVGMQEFAGRWPVLTRFAVLTVAALALVVFVLGGLATALGVAGLLFPQVAIGMAVIGTSLVWLKGAFLGVISSVWGFTAALLANPITWMVIAVVSLVGGLIWAYNTFEIVRHAIDAFIYALGYVAGVVIRFGGIILGYLLNPLNLIRDAFNLVTNFLAGINLYESGRKILGTLIGGIKSMLGAPAELVSSAFAKVRNLLPFSDAKEGPLSSLTLSGARIMETLGTGVKNAAPGLQKTVAASLAGVALATATPAMALETPELADLQAQAAWQASAPTAPALPDIAANADWQAQAFVAPELPDLQAQAAWQASTPTTPALPDITADAAWQAQPPVATDLPDLQAQAAWQASVPTAPALPDITADADWQAQAFVAPELPDLQAQAAWQASAPITPALPDITADAAWQAQPPVAADLPDLQAQAGWQATAPTTPVLPDITADADWQAQPPVAADLPDLQAQAGWQTTAPTAPALPDITADADWQAQAFVAPELPDLQAQAAWQASAPTTPALPDITADAAWQAQPPVAADLPDLQAQAGWQTTAPTAPALPDITADADWQAQPPVAADLPDLQAQAAWQASAPITPALPDISANAGWQTQPLATTDLPDLQAQAAWQTGAPNTPTLPDISANALWQTQPLATPDLPDLQAQVAWQTASLDAPKLPAPIKPISAAPQKSPEQTQTKARTEQSAKKSIQIHIGNITLPGVSNPDDFLKQLQALVEAHDG